MHQNLLRSVEGGLVTCAVYCNLSKTFDIIDHEVLPRKLDNFWGLEAFLHLKPLVSYLQGR